MKLSIYDGKATDKKEWSFAHRIDDLSKTYCVDAVDSQTGIRIARLYYIGSDGLIMYLNAKQTMESKGYDTSAIAWSGDRIKIFMVED